MTRTPATWHAHTLPLVDTHVRTQRHTAPGRPDATKHCHVKNQWSALLWWFLLMADMMDWKDKLNQNRATNSNGPSSKKTKKYVHEEWQIVVQVQFDTGMIACMFVCWVYVWLFLASEPKNVAAQSIFFFFMFLRLELTSGRVTMLTVIAARGRRSFKKKKPCFYSEGFSVDCRNTHWNTQHLMSLFSTETIMRSSQHNKWDGLGPAPSLTSLM